MKKTEEKDAIEIFAEKVRDFRGRFSEEERRLRREISDDEKRIETINVSIEELSSSGDYDAFMKATSEKNALEMSINWKKKRLVALRKNCLVSAAEADELESLKQSALEEMNAEYEKNRIEMSELVRQMILLGQKNKYRVNLLNKSEDDLGYYVLHDRRYRNINGDQFFGKDRISPFVGRAFPGKQKRGTRGGWMNSWVLLNPFEENEEYKWSEIFNWRE